MRMTGLVHCRNEMKAQSVREALQARLAECRGELHPTKTSIVYCKDDRRQSKSESVMFVFLGYCFRARSVLAPHSQKMFCGFTPAVSKPALNPCRRRSGLETSQANRGDAGRYCSRAKPDD